MKRWNPADGAAAELSDDLDLVLHAGREVEEWLQNAETVRLGRGAS